MCRQRIRLRPPGSGVAGRGTGDPAGFRHDFDVRRIATGMAWIPGRSAAETQGVKRERPALLALSPEDDRDDFRSSEHDSTSDLRDARSLLPALPLPGLCAGGTSTRASDACWAVPVLPRNRDLF